MQETAPTIRFFGAGRPAPAQDDRSAVLEACLRRAAEAEERRRVMEGLCPGAVALLRGPEVVELNAAGARLLGLPSPEAACGRSLLAFLGDGGRRVMEPLLRDPMRVGAGTRPLCIELEDGRRLHVQVRAARATWCRNTWVWLIQDISEQVRAESARRLLQDQVDAGEPGRFTVPLDDEGRILGWPRPAALTTGRSHGEMFWSHFSTLLAAEECAAGWPERILEEASVEGRSQGEARIHLAGGAQGARLVLERHGAGFLLTAHATEPPDEGPSDWEGPVRDLQGGLRGLRRHLGRLQAHQDAADPAGTDPAARHMRAIAEAALGMATALEGLPGAAPPGGEDAGEGDGADAP